MINLIVNGNSYSYPQPGDKANTGWGSQTTNWASAVTAALTALGLGGTLTPTPNAVVDISSTTKGILVPRLTTTQRNAITSPATSLLIFNTTLGVFQYYSGSAWITIGAKIPDNVQFDGTLTVNGNISTNGGITAVGAVTGASLNTTGNANITGKALTGDGLVGAPTHSFINDPDSGLYRISENKIGFAANGVRQGEFGVGYGGFTGNVIQTVYVNNDTTTATSSSNTSNTSPTATGLKLSITPKYSNSKLLIQFRIANYTPNGQYIHMRIKNNTTNAFVGPDKLHSLNNTVGREVYVANGFIYIDSPGTTSNEFEIYFYVSGSSGEFNVNSYPNGMMIMEIQQ